MLLSPADGLCWTFLVGLIDINIGEDKLIREVKVQLPQIESSDLSLRPYPTFSTIACTMGLGTEDNYM
ncbi:MAG: hypothetical protein GX977_11720 [Firmicutes bacterium]|nr:hypothetical protein [Bacillota bacterium]